MCALRGRLRSLPILVLALLFFGLRLPDSPTSALAWILATIGALMLGGAITTLLNIALHWTLAGEGVVHLTQAVVVLFCGLIVPLPLYPDWLRTAGMSKAATSTESSCDRAAPSCNWPDRS